MAGGLLNLIAIGNQNIILNGNPTKSFFKAKYAKYTNFGLQKFRIDQTGTNGELDIMQEKTVTFKISRYGDLLMDTYLVVTLPDIWSPILKYEANSVTEYRPYEFQWIKNIGSQIISEVVFSIGSTEVQKFSGSYIQNVVERDFDTNKKELFNIMTGNTEELNNPANYANRSGNYPNAFKQADTDISGIEPSIPETQLFIPINTWYSLITTMALPLICLQYAELVITFKLRPIQELFTIKDVIYDTSTNPIKSYNDIPRIKTNQSEPGYEFYRFIQEPPKRDISSNTSVYNDKRVNINSDIHLLTTQCFLDTEERVLFANNKQDYLIKLVYETTINLKQKSGKVKFDTYGLVANWMWYFRRNDVSKRNEWSNYTNWEYENQVPNYLEKLVDTNDSDIFYATNENYAVNDPSKNIFITGHVPDDFTQKNHKEILKDFAIICDGKYRENSLPAGVYNKIEKYMKTMGNVKDGLYNYNFCLNSDPFRMQPTGAFNTNKFKTVEFEYNLVSNPPFNREDVNFTTICNPDTGEVIATSKEVQTIYSYHYDLHIFEERYNILTFQSGTAELAYSR